MPIDDSKPQGRDANFKAGPIAETFSKAVDLDAQVATLSPAGQQQCRAIQQLSAERLESEKASQQRSHGFRVMRTKVELLENYIRHPAPRPPGIVADPTNDLKIIHEQAEQSVRDREAGFLKNIERETDANVRQVITRERKGHEPGRGTPDHDHGHGG